MNAFTIRDLENLSGIKAHTIRIWEQRYSFLKPKRSSTNIRYYDSEELKKLLNVALLNKYGFKISHINKMDPETIREKILSLSSIEARQERMINDLLQSMVDFDTTAFEDILDQNIQTHGINNTVQSLIFPFLQRIGILWMTDRVRVAQEHLVSNIVRQKLILGIEKARAEEVRGKTVVMFLPDGEYHELGLLFVYYLLKTRGANVIYLGADVPVSELKYVADIRKPDYLYTHLTCLPVKLSFDAFLQELAKQLPGVPVVISGRVIQQAVRKIPENVYFKKTLNEVISELSG